MKTALRLWALLLPALLLASCAAPIQQPLDPGNRHFSITTGTHAFRGGRPLVSVTQGNRTFPALADTGATRSLIAIEDDAHRTAARATRTEWIGAHGDPLEGVPITLWINDTPHPGFAIAASKAPWSGEFPMLIGLDVLRSHHVVFDYASCATRWGKPPSGRPIRGEPSLFVLPSPRNDEWIILDTGAVNSYYLESSQPLVWEGTVTTPLRLVSAAHISRDMQSRGKRVGVVGMQQQRRSFGTFATASGGLNYSAP